MPFGKDRDTQLSGGTIYGPDNVRIAEVYHSPSESKVKRSEGEHTANADRIVACVNWCQGIETRDLECMGIGSALNLRDCNFADRQKAEKRSNELIEALKTIIARIDGIYDYPGLVAFGPLGTTASWDARLIAFQALSKAIP